MDPIVVVQDLKKHYGDVRAVNGISFSVEPGVIFAMLGPNGAGKSTTVEILEGLRERDSGYVSVLGLDPGRQQGALSERIGIQLQSSALFPKLSAREHLQMFGSFYRNAHDIDDLLDLVGLTERQKAYSENLSGGQQQRLAVALALLSDPELVFLDEPTTGLDPQARRRLWEVVTQMKERGTTVFLTTHFMDEAETLADHLVIVDNGKIIAADTPGGLIRANFGGATLTFNATSEFAGLDLERLTGVEEVISADGGYELSIADATTALPEVFALASRTGAALDDVHVHRPNLEDVFLKLTGRRIRD